MRHRFRDKKKYVQKKGRYGTLYRYAIDYTDKYDDAFGRHTWHTWAYDQGHALDNFYDDGDEGWKHLDIHRMIDRS